MEINEYRWSNHYLFGGMMNEEIRNLEDNIIALLNDSFAPIEAKRLIIKDIYRMVEQKAEEIILDERSSHNNGNAENL